MAVDVKLAPTFEHGSAKALFDPRIGGISTAPGFRYDVAPDGKRFLVITRPPAEEAPAPTSITVVLNWTSGLKR